MSVFRQPTTGRAIPEMDWLLDCVRTSIPPSRQPVPNATIDWSKLVAMTMRHRVLPMVCQRLGIDQKGAPEAVREQLRDLNLRNAACNMARTAALLHLLHWFESKNLTVVSFRGPVLAESVYGDVAQRQFADLDFLVHPQDVAAISRLLVEDGFEPQFRLNERQEQALIRFRTERCFIRSADRLTVDVHWRLLPNSFAFEADDALWARCIRTSVQGVDVLTLADEDLALFLCIHGAKHGWDQLALLCDLAGMLHSRPTLNWEGILRRAEKAGKQRMMWVGLQLIEELLGVPIPQSIQRMAEGRAERRRVDELKERLLGGMGIQEGGGWGKWRIEWGLLERCRDRLAYMADLVMIPTGLECEKVDFPRGLFFGYYLLRLGRMVGKPFSRRTNRTGS